MILYYNKQNNKITQTQSEDTIPMTDELMADYRHYAGNQQDKSLELVQEVGEIPYLVRYQLDEEGNRYSSYLATADVDGIFQPDTQAILLEDTNNLVQSLENAVQEYIDSQAKNRGYDSIVSACSYAGYTNEFQTEATALGVWRSAVWTKAYQVQADVEDGTIPMPTVDELILMLPIFGA